MRLKKMIWVIVGLSLVGVVSVSGCSPKREVKQPEGKPISIRLTVGTDPVYTPFFVADKLGLFSKNGLDASLKMFAIGRQGIEAMMAGEADVNGSSPTPWALFIDQGADFVLVAAHTADPYSIKFVARTNIKEPKDLLGKKIGVSKGTAADYAWQRFLAFHGIKQDQITWVNVEPPETIAIMDRGDIDAFALWEPYPSKALNVMGNKVHVLATGADNDIYTAILTVGVTRKYATENPEGVKRLLRSLDEAGKFVRDNPEKAADIVAEITKWDRDQVLRQIKGSRYGAFLDDKVIKDFYDTAEWLKGLGKLKNVPDWKKYINPAYLKEVNPAAVQLSNW